MLKHKERSRADALDFRLNASFKSTGVSGHTEELVSTLNICSRAWACFLYKLNNKMYVKLRMALFAHLQTCIICYAPHACESVHASFNTYFNQHMALHAFLCKCFNQGTVRHMHLLQQSLAYASYARKSGICILCNEALHVYLLQGNLASVLCKETLQVCFARNSCMPFLAHAL